jgi:hypothetical protein
LVFIEYAYEEFSRNRVVLCRISDFKNSLNVLNYFLREKMENDDFSIHQLGIYCNPWIFMLSWPR